MFAAEIRKKRMAQMGGYPQWRWHLDEVFVKINGKLCYLWVSVMRRPRGADQAALAWAGLDAQFQGSSSPTRLIGWSAMRAMTSASQASGSTSLRRAVSMSVYMIAARRPPSSEPSNR